MQRGKNFLDVAFRQSGASHAGKLSTILAKSAETGNSLKVENFPYAFASTPLCYEGFSLFAA